MGDLSSVNLFGLPLRSFPSAMIKTIFKEKKEKGKKKKTGGDEGKVEKEGMCVEVLE